MRRKKFRIAAALGFALLLCVSVCLVSTRRSAVAAGSWGLCFREAGKAPVTDVPPETLARYGAACIGDTSKKELCLTFDAGYENGFTPAILDVLKERGVKATFFLVGNYLEQNPDLVRRMAAEGHTVANHTYHHPDMSAIEDPAAFEEELRSLEDLYRQLTGEELAKFYRPPQGLYSEENLRQAQRLGYKTLFWSLAYADWDNDRQPDPEKALETLRSRTHNGAVILLHSTSATNAAILGDLLDGWLADGYTFIAPDALFSP